MNHKITAAFAVICVVSSVLSGCSIKIGEVTDEKTMISQPENITADITVNTPDFTASSTTEHPRYLIPEWKFEASIDKTASSNNSVSSNINGEKENLINHEMVSVYGKHSVLLNEIPNIAKILGRTVSTPKGFVCEMSASGFEIEGILEGDIAVDIDLSNAVCSCYISVSVDGVLLDKLKLDDGLKTYTLAGNLKKGEHKIEVRKLTEAYFNSIVIGKLSFTGQLKPLSAAKRKIEIIGDSITCGLDIDIPGAPQGDIGEFEDGTRTYGALAAKSFGADYNVFSVSGWGCIGGAGGAAASIPRIYDQCTYTQYYEEKWDFSSWQADVVVINLGTNDGGYIWQNHLTDRDFETAVKDFLLTVRKKYPHAKIIWAYGMMGSGVKNLIQNVIEELNKTDPDYAFVKLPQHTRSSDSHPGPDDHQRAADMLSSCISKVTGWKQK